MHTYIPFPLNFIIIIIGIDDVEFFVKHNRVINIIFVIIIIYIYIVYVNGKMYDSGILQNAL